LNLPPPDALERNSSKGFRKYCSRKHVQNKLLTHNSKAFTLSEILIALVIIGIVTILTVPHFLNNIQDKEFLTASKRINYLISQAVGSLNVSSGINAATSPEDFVNNYLSKVMKFTKICGYSNHADCGFSNKIKDVAKTEMNLPTIVTDLQNSILNGENTWISANRKGYSFVSLNGYSMMLFYNQNCLDDKPNVSHYVEDRICINILFDINGDKKPNQVGKDIGFTTVLFPTNSVTVTPVSAPSNANSVNFSQVGETCKIYGKNYRAPSRYEFASMYANGKLIEIVSGFYWTASSAGSGLAWRQLIADGACHRNVDSAVYPIRCIKK
jgi:prepilin-type N-terminal cleavage/methylation domain-containing protein